MNWLNIFIGTGVVTLISLVIGFILAIAAKYLFVEMDTRYDTLLKMLPGINCGMCGEPGCAGFTNALLEGRKSKVSMCRPSKPDQREKIKDYLNSTPGPDGKALKVEV